MNAVQQKSVVTTSIRAAFAALGSLFALIGLIGAFVPLLPTTIFVLLAGYCFARSSPRLETWLLTHPILGPPLRNWRRNGAISRRAKWVAACMIAFSYAFTMAILQPAWWIGAGLAIVLGGVAGYLITRPDA